MKTSICKWLKGTRDECAFRQKQTACHRRKALPQLDRWRMESARGAFLTPAIVSSRRDHGGPSISAKTRMPAGPEQGDGTTGNAGVRIGE